MQSVREERTGTKVSSNTGTCHRMQKQRKRTTDRLHFHPQVRAITYCLAIIRAEPLGEMGQRKGQI